MSLTFLSGIREGCYLSDLWEVRAELFAACVGLLGIGAVLFGVGDLRLPTVMCCRDPVWRKSLRWYRRVEVCSLHG